MNRPFLLLAIEARRSRLGYALFEGPKRLLDWGSSMLPSHLSSSAAVEAARKRAASVLRRRAPAALVLTRPRRTKTGPNVDAGPVFWSVLEEARALAIPFHFLSREEIRAEFCTFRARSKEEIAWTLTTIFPEIISRLPLKRTKWQAEKRGMVVFDAIAVGLAYWMRHGAGPLQPE
jgi:hypothetical protein